MADPRRLLGEPGRKRRVARRNDRPAIDENLRADLFRDGLAVDFDRAARGRLDPALEIEPGGMFGRVAVAAPPQNGAMLHEIV